MFTGTTRCRFILTTVMLLLVCGCWSKGPKPVPVSGMVLIDGVPLGRGFIRVVPESGRPSGGQIGKDGRFSLGCFTDNDGCITGTHRVEVSAVENLSETKRRWLAPKKYASAGTSGLTVTIDGPTTDVKINLTWAGSPQKGPFIEEVSDEFRGQRRPGPQHIK
jgi:hypothetical protein